MFSCGVAHCLDRMGRLRLVYLIFLDLEMMEPRWHLWRRVCAFLFIRLFGWKCMDLHRSKSIVFCAIVRHT